ncbi:hypothetical protein K2173_010269 [Erythroxylum novogranatense]|uniref:RING-type domain-containing protein n=1 Tax=Erythroxylum novogranatense TaxID=1862640 RepID=A0AAV8TFQ6_9ROSI|nr:hypothetical protein K2173_010269 [Erythroxylum novogranatense]
MGFPVGYTELLLPKLVLHILSLLGLIRKLINNLFRVLGLPDFLEPGISWPHAAVNHLGNPDFDSVSAILIREILPVVHFSDLVESNPSDSCAVCLYEFEGSDEIRRLTNCTHIFHKSCLDRWMGYDHKTCPLCRTPVIPDDMQDAFNERWWAASGIPEFYGDYSPISGL